MWGSARYSEAVYVRVLDHRGEWDEAESLARELMTSFWLGKLVVLPIIGSIEARQGRASARETLCQAWNRARTAVEFQRMWPAAAAIAEYAWISGDRDIPIDEIKDVMQIVIDAGFDWNAGLIALWLWKLGELDTVPDGIAEPYRLLMEGEPLDAAKILEERGLPYERAIALMHGDSDAKLEALEVLEDLGATAVADKLRQDLRTAGVAAPRRRSRRTATLLTARQSEVLALLAEDLSNADIADRLFLSPRTVEHHVEAVMSKLNASTRQEAVAKAAERDLLPV